MTILFPNHPLKARLPDPDYEIEFTAAKEAGFSCELYSLESVREGNVAEALRVCEPVPGTTMIHRGWMMSDMLYRSLYEGVIGKGARLATSPQDYAGVHYLPNAYRHIENETAKSAWMTGRDMDEAWRLYESVSSADVMVKDWVKSAKHRWREACFIPAHTPRERFEEIIRAFFQARGNLFEKGIVFRRIHPLVQLEMDLRGQPVHEEYRLFFWNSELIAATPPVRNHGPLEDLGRWQAVARRFSAKFLTIDVARQEDGSWLIIEVGDGGVSGLPTSIDPDAFYQSLARLAGVS